MAELETRTLDQLNALSAVNGDDLIPVQPTGGPLMHAQADALVALLASQSLTLAGQIYESEVLGRVAVTDGKLFAAVGATNASAIDVWRRDSAAGSTLVASYPSLTGLQEALAEASRSMQRITANLLSLDGLTLSARLEADGQVLFDAGGCLTDYLPVKPLTTYSLVKFTDDGTGVDGGRVALGSSAAGPARIHVYSAAKALLRAMVSPLASQFTTGAADAFVRISGILASQRNLYMLVEGETLPSVFTPYESYQLPEWIAPHARPYEGQIIAVIGDSNWVANDSPAAALLQPLGLTNNPALRNITEPREERDALAGRALERRPDYGVESTTNHSITEAHLQADRIDPQASLVVLGIGTNGWGSPFRPGVLASEANRARLGDLDAQWEAYLAGDPLDDTTTCGAAILLISKVRARCPHADIIWPLPFPREDQDDRLGKLSGLTLREYCDALIRVCDRMGVRWIDTWSIGLNPTNAANKAVNYTDHVHLSAAGRALAGQALLQAILAPGATAVTPVRGAPGMPGKDLSEIGSFAVAKATNILAAVPGASLIRLTDRKASRWRRWVGAALDAQGVDMWWFTDAGGSVWMLDEDWWSPDMLGAPAPLAKHTDVVADARSWIVELLRKWRATPSQFGCDLSGGYWGLSDFIHIRNDDPVRGARLRLGGFVMLPGSSGQEAVILSLMRVACAGKISVYGTGGVDYTTRTWRHLISLRGCYRSTVPDGYHIENAQSYGLFWSTLTADGAGGGNNIFFHIGAGQGFNMGSAAGQVNGSGLSFTIVSCARSGTAGSTSQATQVVFAANAALPDFTNGQIKAEDWFGYEHGAGSEMAFEREGFCIKSIDGPNTLTFYGWLPGNPVTGGTGLPPSTTMWSMHGGGYYIDGSNTASCSVGEADFFRVGVGGYDRGLYGSHKGRIQTQVSGCNRAFGNPWTSASYGHEWAGGHSESTWMDVCCGSTAGKNGQISGPWSAFANQTAVAAGHDLSAFTISAPRDASDTPQAGTFMGGALFWTDNGPVITRSGPAGGLTSSAITLGNEQSNNFWQQTRNTNVVRFKPNGGYARKLAGHNVASFILFGDGARNQPTGTQTIGLHADSVTAGWTWASGGTADIVVSGLDGPMRGYFEIVSPRLKTVAFRWDAITEPPKAGSATIAAGASSLAISFAAARADTLYAITLTSADPAQPVGWSLKSASGFTINRVGTSGTLAVDWTITENRNN